MKAAAVVVLALCLAAPSALAWATPNQRMQHFIQKMQERHGFSRSSLQAVFQGVSLKPSIINAMNRPAEAMHWPRYQALLVSDQRIAQGVAFWQANAAALEKAQHTYGVPPAVIVAIIGIESRYGQTLGNHRVLDALSTLAFAYPRRAAYFEKELEQFLLLARDQGISPLQAQGSYAGAMGLGQFMPSSYRRMAVDFDGDGHKNMFEATDAIGSVANYLAKHGWRRGQPIAVAARCQRQIASKVVHRSVAAWAAQGVLPPPGLRATSTARLLQPDAAQSAACWLGLHNFETIRRYNASNYYALATAQLSQAIDQRYHP